jgi:hypothetical protein
MHGLCVQVVLARFSCQCLLPFGAAIDLHVCAAAAAAAATAAADVAAAAAAAAAAAV